MSADNDPWKIERPWYPAERAKVREAMRTRKEQRVYGPVDMTAAEAESMRKRLRYSASVLGVRIRTGVRTDERGRRYVLIGVLDKDQDQAEPGQRAA